MRHSFTLCLNLQAGWFLQLDQSPFLLIGAWGFEVVFGFQTMHSMNSLTGSLGVFAPAKYFSCCCCFPWNKSHSSAPVHLFYKLPPAISTSHSYTYCTIVTLTDHQINPTTIQHTYKTCVFAVWLMEVQSFYTLVTGPLVKCNVYHTFLDY